MKAFPTLLVCFLGLCVPAMAQIVAAQYDLALTLDGINPGDQFGFSVAAIGDLTGDGRNDIVIGAPRAFPGMTETGFVRAIHSATGATIWTTVGVEPGGSFGRSLDVVGDIDGDGKSEVLVAADFHTLSPIDEGKIYVLSGATGSILSSDVGAADRDALGFAVSRLGDIDGDGIPDYAAAANQGFSILPTDVGYVRIYSGATHTILRTMHGATFDDEFGANLASVGDVDADGVLDLAVYSKVGTASNVGRVTVFSGTVLADIATHPDGVNPPALMVLNGASADDRFGECISGVGDVNGDGHADFMVGYRDDSLALDGGAVQIHSGLNGAVLHVYRCAGAGAMLGSRRIRDARIGDINGDGVADFVLTIQFDDDGPGRLDVGSVWTISGTHAATPGSTTLAPGAPGVLAWAYGAAPGDRFGFAATAMGDLNGDGLGDLVVTTPFVDGPGGIDIGNLAILRGVNRHFPGTGDDFVLSTGVNGPATQIPDIKTFNTLDGFVINYRSPLGTYDGAATFLVAQLFSTGSPPAPYLPYVHVNPLVFPAPLVVFNSTITGPFGPLNIPLPPGGFTFTGSLFGAPGLSGIIQAFRISGATITATDGHELRHL